MSVIINLLSLVTTSLCVFLKVPQIVILYRRKSADGLSHAGLTMELTSYSNTVAYCILQGYSLPLYLEYFPLLISDIIICVLVFKYSESRAKLLEFGLLSSFTLHLCTYFGVIPDKLITVLVSVAIPLGVLSKILQLWKIIAAKYAGSVSSLSWALNAISGFSRFISLWLSVGETHKDTLLMYSIGLSASLNCAVSIAALHYGDVKPKKID